MINYEHFDKKLTRYYADQLLIANNIGFDTVSEAMEELYRKYQSTKLVGDMLGYGKSTVRKHLKAMGVELIKRGGYQRKFN